MKKIVYFDFKSDVPRKGSLGQHYHCGRCGRFLGNNLPKLPCNCCKEAADDPLVYMGFIESQYSHPDPTEMGK